MLQILKNFYFRLRDNFFTAQYRVKQRRKLEAIKKASRNFEKKSKKQKTTKKIGFYIYAKNHLAHLQPIFSHLSKDQFEIIVSGDHAIPEYLLQVEYRVRTDLEILSSGEKFKILVSLYMIAPQWIRRSFSDTQDNHFIASCFLKN